MLLNFFLSVYKQYLIKYIAGLHDLKLRFLHAHMYICDGTHIIISSQVTVAKITMNIGFVNLGMAVTINDDISKQVTVSKMTVHIGFLSLLMVVKFAPGHNFPSISNF